MNYEIINTGSDGNCTIINNIIALDLGVSYKRLTPYQNSLKLVFISHIHGDHFNKKTVKKLASNRPTLRFAVGDYLVEDLLKCGVNRKNIDILEIGTVLVYGIFELEPIKLVHDVPNLGVRLFMNSKKLIYATDTNTLDEVTAKDYDVYLIEGNYENADELHERAYTIEYEERVKSTHLSREYATKWLLENMSENSIYEFMHQHKERGKQC